MVIVIIKIFVPSNHYLYVPHLGREFNEYPPVSLTGHHCALRCKHCNARILERMTPVRTPQDLIRVVERLYRGGARSVLISGGSNVRGRVPFEGFVDAIRYAKRLGMRIYMHVGLVDEYRAQLLKEVGIDVALIDFTIEEKVIREVLNLRESPESFINSIRNLIRFSVRVVPHIIIGIYCGKPSGEKQAIDVLNMLYPNAVVLAVFSPLSNTPFENCSPPQPSYVSEILRYARRILKDIPLSYGCMKPHGEAYQPLEVEALELGFDGLSFPSYSTVEYLIESGTRFEIIEECCAYVAISR